MSAHDVRGGPRCTRIVGLPVLIVILCQILAAPAAALEWQFEDVDIRLDTTLSQGVSVRTSARDPAIIGIANGGTAHSVNHDDGTLNYDDGKIAQNVSRFTSDLDIDGGALSAFSGSRDSSTGSSATEPGRVLHSASRLWTSSARISSCWMLT